MKLRNRERECHLLIFQRKRELEWQNFQSGDTEVEHNSVGRSDLLMEPDLLLWNQSDCGRGRCILLGSLKLHFTGQPLPTRPCRTVLSPARMEALLLWNGASEKVGDGSSSQAFQFKLSTWETEAQTPALKKFTQYHMLVRVL